MKINTYQQKLATPITTIINKFILTSNRQS